MPRHNLYQMMLNCEDWRSSTTVAGMSAAARGVYIDLLAAAWLTDDCTLPVDEGALRRLARPDSDAQWVSVWAELRSLFTERNGRLFNKVQMKVFMDSNALYEKRRDANEKRKNKKGGKTTTNTTTNTTTKPPTKTLVTDNRQQITDSREHITDNTTKEPWSVGSILTGFTGTDRGSLQELREVVGEDNWRTSWKRYQWAHDTYPEWDETMDIIRNARNPELRESKGQSEIAKPGGFLWGRVQVWAKSAGVEIPNKYEFSKMYESEAAHG